MRSRSRPARFVHADVPYHCQWESRALAGPIAYRLIRAVDDPLWRQSGAHTRDEYELGSRSACGVACLRMLLAHRFGSAPPSMDLYRRCLAAGAYRIQPDGSVRGLIYAPFLTFVKETFGLCGQILLPMTLDDIRHALADGFFVIASVHREIRRPWLPAPARGGHLILMLGYDEDAGSLIFHNPSGETPQTQEYVELPVCVFASFFGSRGMVIQ